jgi:hypothetical protein
MPTNLPDPRKPHESRELWVDVLMFAVRLAAATACAVIIRSVWLASST